MAKIISQPAAEWTLHIPQCKDCGADVEFDGGDVRYKPGWSDQRENYTEPAKYYVRCPVTDCYATTYISKDDLPFPVAKNAEKNRRDR